MKIQKLTEEMSMASSGFRTRAHRADRYLLGDLEASDGPLTEASTHLEKGKQRIQPGNHTDLSISSEEDIDIIDDDSVSQDLENKKGKRRVKRIARPVKKALKERIATAPRPLAQQAEYAKLVEDRLADVEKRLRKMESQRRDRFEVEETTEPDSPDPQTIFPEPREKDPEILGINRVTFEQYKPNKSSNPRPSRRELRRQHREGPILLPETPQGHVIDVVVPHTSASEAFQSSSGIEPSGISTATKALPRDALAERLVLQNTQNVIPERIRINSDLLTGDLEAITGHRFAWPSNESRAIWKQSRILKDQVILRPFKILVTYEQEIREHVRLLKEKFAIRDAEISMSISGAEFNSELPQDLVHTELEVSKIESFYGSKTYSWSRRDLQELQVLVDVLDHDLNPVFDLRRRIQEGDIRSIAFCDLWHLFRIGGEIRVNEGHSQIYRIVDISGGRPPLCSREEADVDYERGVETKDPPTTFTINSFCYGFDGKHLGEVQRIFEIEKYDDPKPVTSLPVYPVQFSGIEDGDLKHEDFIRRGKKFVELTKDKSAVVHKRYHGLTMGLEELREEVRE